MGKQKRHSADAAIEAPAFDDADLVAAVAQEIRALVEKPVRRGSVEVESTITRVLVHRIHLTVPCR